MQEADYTRDAQSPVASSGDADKASRLLRDYSAVSLTGPSLPGLSLPGEHESVPATLVSDDEFAPLSQTSGVEIAGLRRLLAEKDHAILRTAVATSELEQRVEEAEAKTAALLNEVQSAKTASDPSARPPMAVSLPEMAKLKLEWRRAIKTLEQETNQRKAEIVQIRSQWHTTQRELEQVRQLRRVEASQASAKITALERDLAVAGASSGTSHAALPEVSKRKWLIAAAAVVCVVVAVAVTWSQLTPRTGVRAASPRSPETEQVSGAPVESLPALRNAAPAGSPAPSLLTPQNFGGSLGRLNSALSGTRGRSPEQVLSEVRRKASRPGAPVCDFQWNGGQPSLVFGGTGKSLTLAATLDNCAAAVEKYK